MTKFLKMILRLTTTFCEKLYISLLSTTILSSVVNTITVFTLNVQPHHFWINVIFINDNIGFEWKKQNKRTKLSNRWNIFHNKFYKRIFIYNNSTVSKYLYKVTYGVATRWNCLVTAMVVPWWEPSIFDTYTLFSL